MYKKFASFWLILFVFIFLALLSAIPSEFVFNGIRFRNPDIFSEFRDVLSNKTDSENTKTPIINNIATSTIDTLAALTFRLNIDSIAEQERNDLRITSYTGEQIIFSRFFPALARVRDSLASTRVAYFGDSMIEGDLISHTLRNDLQSAMGGKGVGFVPITSIVSQFRRSIKHEFSSDWKEFSIQKSKEKKNFAPSGFLYNPRSISKAALKDTNNTHDVSWVRYAAPSGEFKTLNTLYTTKLYYGVVPTGTFIKYTIDGKTYKKNLLGKNHVNTLTLNASNAYNELYIEFYTDSVFDVYGVSFESPSGVFVDNYAVRGNLGMALQKIPTHMLRAFDSIMDYSLLIFQFGLNVASPEARAFGWYENAMVDVVNYYRELIPEADILIISIGDKSAKYDMEFVTQPGIPRLVEAQRNIANRTQSHFWNLFNSMGGYNSMKSWVERTMPLASKDYTHINFKGAEKISALLVQNFLNEFRLYEFNILKESQKTNLLNEVLASESFLTANFINFKKQLETAGYNFDMNEKQIAENETIEEAPSVVSPEAANLLICEFRVQIGASKVKLDTNVYDSIVQKIPGKKLRIIRHNDNFYRYYVSPFISFDSAQTCAEQLIKTGTDAFVVGFINGDRAPIERVLAQQQVQNNTIQMPHSDIITETTEISRDSSMKFIQLKKTTLPLPLLNFRAIYNGNLFNIDTLENYVMLTPSMMMPLREVIPDPLPEFRVQFCASLVPLDVAFYQNIIDYFGDSLIIISNDSDGMIRYMLGNYASYAEADVALRKVFELNQDGYITAYLDNKRIKTETAINIVNKKMNKQP